MPTTNELWSKLPRFMKRHQTIRANLLDYMAPSEAPNDSYYKEMPIEKANMITSLDNSSWGTHRPVIDIDMGVAVLPSTNPGNFHLFIDKQMSKDDYFRLLEVMVDVGIVEEGFFDAAKAKGASGVRLPWIDKNNHADNAFDPDEYKDSLSEQIRAAELLLKDLREKEKQDYATLPSGWINVP